MQILALFTLARRTHLQLSQAQLAHQLGIRRDQVSRAERALPCGQTGRAALCKFNEWRPSP